MKESRAVQIVSNFKMLRCFRQHLYNGRLPLILIRQRQRPWSNSKWQRQLRCVDAVVDDSAAASPIAVCLAQASPSEACLACDY